MMFTCQQTLCVCCFNYMLRKFALSDKSQRTEHSCPSFQAIVVMQSYLAAVGHRCDRNAVILSDLLLFDCLRLSMSSNCCTITSFMPSAPPPHAPKASSMDLSPITY